MILWGNVRPPYLIEKKKKKKIRRKRNQEIIKERRAGPYPTPPIQMILILNASMVDFDHLIDAQIHYLGHILILNA